MITEFLTFLYPDLWADKLKFRKKIDFFYFLWLVVAIFSGSVLWGLAMFVVSISTFLLHRRYTGKWGTSRFESSDIRSISLLIRADAFVSVIILILIILPFFPKT